MNHGRFIVGSDDNASGDRVCEALLGLDTTLFFISHASAEMAKHAIHGFRGTAAIFTNELARMSKACNVVSIDDDAATTTDPRIGPAASVEPRVNTPGDAGARLQVPDNYRVRSRFGDASGNNNMPSNDTYKRWAVDQVLQANRNQGSPVLGVRLDGFKCQSLDNRVGILPMGFKHLKSVSFHQVLNEFPNTIRLCSTEPQSIDYGQ